MLKSVFYLDVAGDSFCIKGLNRAAAPNESPQVKVQILITWGPELEKIFR